MASRQLVLVIRGQIEYHGVDVRRQVDLLKYTGQLASEIELLNPAVDKNGQRPDNCEYPWEDGLQLLHYPLDWSFTVDQLLRDRRFGPTFVKLLQAAINRAVQEL